MDDGESELLKWVQSKIPEYGITGFTKGKVFEDINMSKTGMMEEQFVLSWVRIFF